MTREELISKWEGVQISCLPAKLPISTEYIDRKLAQYGSADNVDKFLTTLYINALTDALSKLPPDCRFMLAVAMDMSAPKPAMTATETEQLNAQATA